MSESNPVIEHLDRAVQAAERTGMSASQVIGLLFFYAMSVSQDALEFARKNQGSNE